MGLSLLRRRSPEVRRATEEANLSSPKKKSFFSLSLPSIIFALILLSLYCSFTTLLPSSFHYCIHSRRLNHLCVTRGAKLALVQTLNANSRNAVHEARADDPKLEIEKAVEVVKENVQALRSWSSNASRATGRSSCDDKGIFVYDLPPKFNDDILSECHDWIPWANLCDYFSNDAMGRTIPEMGKGWYKTHQYSLEPIFHKRVLNHPCRVLDSESAKLFYVPFYGGLDVLRWHFKNVSSDVKDALGLELVRWLETQQPWARSAGKDHMFVLGKISWDFRRPRDGQSWGNNFLLLDAMRNPYKLLIERQPWELNEIGIPHPTHFHPHDDANVAAWQSRIISSWRRSLVGFAGAARPEATENIRSVLIKQCNSSSAYCKFLDCRAGSCAQPHEVIALFMESEFCMQPPGDSPTRKSVFDSLVSGCIPVLFSPFTAYYQYPWHLPEDHRRYSVFINEAEVREGKVDVVERLKRVPVEERHEMRRYIVYELMPGLVYGDSSSKFQRFRDAFDITMDNLIERMAAGRSNL